MPNIIRVATSYIFSVFVAVFLLIVPDEVLAVMSYATVQNKLPVPFSVTLTNNGYGMVGTSLTKEVAGNSTGSLNKDLTDGAIVRVRRAATFGGGPYYDGYYCIRYSTVSIAHANSQPCGDSSMSGEISTPNTIYVWQLYVVIDVGVAPNCVASNLTWGASGFCSATVPASPLGSSIPLNSGTAGANGSATAYCASGTWQVQSPVCTAALSVPTALAASQGTIQGKVQLTWGGVTGASSYEVQYRAVGSPTWASAPGVASGWQLSTTNESVFEFQVRATNAVGAGAWSASATGFIRPQIMPVFVSQTVPANVRVGATFTATQVWRNTGYTSWSDATFTLIQAAGSGSFGAVPGTFSPAVVQDATGTSTLSLTAPATPGTYSLSRQFSKGGVNYGAPSTPASIKVWGDPVCSALTTDSAYIYDTNGTINVQFTINDQTTTNTAKAWNIAGGEATSRSYTPVFTAGMYKFAIPMSNHGGQTGTYRVRVDVANVVATGSCEVSFELRPLAVPAASLVPLIGHSATANSFAVGQTAAQHILAASITRTENMPLTVELLDEGGAVASSSALAAGAATVNLAGARWAGDAWSIRSYSVRIKYSDPAAASQGMNLNIPVTLILTPNGNSLQLGIAPTHPLTATTLMARGADPYSAALQGNWASKVSVQGGSDLDALLAMDSAGQRQHQLDYNQLYGKTLVGTARAVPAAGITLLAPLEVSTITKLPTLPAREFTATDGTVEDVVRLTWAAPAEGGTGFTYDVFRENDLVLGGTTLTTLEDAPPVRGQEYQYRVVAIHNAAQSGDSVDPGHVPACRAARLIGASLNADMSAINGLLERWDCLAGMTATSAIDAQAPGEMPYAGSSVYRSFSVPVPGALADGAHVLRVGMESEGVTINASRTYDVPFNLNRASIAVNDLSILYNGAKATTGLEASSIGRFGIKMEGGAGIGFAEEIK